MATHPTLNGLSPCQTRPGTILWDRHVQEIKRLQAQADRLNLRPLAKAFSRLLELHQQVNGYEGCHVQRK